MKLNIFLKKYQLVLLISGILVAMLTSKVLYKSDYQEEEKLMPITPTVSPMPSLTPTETPAPSLEEVDPDYPLWRQLPHSGTGFKIDKYIDSMTLLVKLDGVNEKIARKKIEAWLEEEGWEPDSHKLLFEEQ